NNTYDYDTSTHILTINSAGAFVTSLKVEGPSLTATSFTLSNDGTGHLKITDPPADSNPVTVDSGTTTEITLASAQNVTFSNEKSTTGLLVLDKSAQFTGEITGFTGDGTPANSNGIDLKDISFATLEAVTYVKDADSNGGTLVVSDGTN